MKHIHCGEGLLCPKNVNFLYVPNYVRRAGIIPFLVHQGETYVLLGLSKEKNPVWADLGGRTEHGETPIQTAIREYGEESRYVIPPNLNRLNKVLLTGKEGSVYPDQILLVIEVDPTFYNININSAFQSTVPKSKYEDEMTLLQWIPYNDFLSMSGLSRSMKDIQKLLRTI